MIDEALRWDGWLVISGVASAVGLVACLLFIVRYHVATDGSWWRQPDGAANPFGRYLLLRKALLASLFTLVLANRFFPGWAARDAVTAVLFSAFALQTFIPYRLFLKAQAEARSRRKHGAERER